MAVRVLHGDMREQLQALIAEGVRVQSVVTDPPYGLSFMGRHWDAADNIAFRPETWRLCYELLPPGGHLLAFAGTRTYHRMACAIEDAGFELRDTIAWLYGSGFPKSHNVSKGIDKAAGANGSYGEAKSAAHQRYIDKGKLRGDEGHDGWQRPWMDDPDAVANAGRKYTGGTDAARQWDGWGTALKPAMELICVARKPLVGTVAANVLAHGTGALNIDACRVAGVPEPTRFDPAQHGHDGWRMNATGAEVAANASPLGRWPANVVHDGSAEVVKAFPETEPGSDAVRVNKATTQFGFGDGKPEGRLSNGFSDAGGSAARFFYSSKADSDDRLGSKHPTVKPVDLMRWLVRLVTPPGGTCLDPFAGSGTTGMACMAEGFDAILVEREAEYVADIRARIAHVRGEDTPLFAALAPLRDK